MTQPDEFLDLVAETLDVTQILDILGWSEYDLVYALKDVILEQEDDFKDAIA